MFKGSKPQNLVFESRETHNQVVSSSDSGFRSFVTKYARIYLFGAAQNSQNLIE